MVRDFKAAIPLALDDDVAVLRAELDLPDVAAGDVYLLCDQRCALQTSASLASRDVSAPAYAKSPRRGVEIGLQHSCVMWMF